MAARAVPRRIGRSPSTMASSTSISDPSRRPGIVPSVGWPPSRWLTGAQLYVRLSALDPSGAGARRGRVVSGSARADATPAGYGVDRGRGEQHGAGDDEPHVRGDAEKGHPVDDGADDQRAEERGPRAPAPAEQARATDHRTSD